MTNLVADKKAVDTGLRRNILFVRLTEIHDSRETRLFQELLENVDAFSLIKIIAEQDDVITRARKLIRQLPRRRRVVLGDDGVRPMRCNMVRKQAAEFSLRIDEHELDTHWPVPAPAAPLHANGSVTALRGDIVCGNNPVVEIIVLLLGRIASAQFEFVQVVIGDISGYIFTGEARSIKFGDA